MRQEKWLLTFLFAMLLLGATAARAQSPTPPTLEPAFRQMLDNFDVAWETRDAKRFGRSDDAAEGAGG